MERTPFLGRLLMGSGVVIGVLAATQDAGSFIVFAVLIALIGAALIWYGRSPS